MKNDKMSTVQIITLCIAIVGALTGTISFSLQLWEKLKYRPRLDVELIGVYEFPSQSSTPDIVVVVQYRNPSKDRVTVLGTPDIIVKDHLGRNLGKFNLDPRRWNEPLQVALGSQEGKGLCYRGRELSRAIASGAVPEWRSTDPNVMFELVGESTAGPFTAQASGVRLLDKTTVEWLKKAGGIESDQLKTSEQVAPPDKK